MTTLHEQYFRMVYDDFAAKIEVLSKFVQSSYVEQGTIVEDAVRALLQEYLPKRYSFGTGFVIDCNGQQSRQCDIIIYDALATAGILGRTGPYIFPVETVYAVVEVKTTFTKSELVEAFRNISSVRSLVSTDPFNAELEQLRRCGVDTRPKPPVGVVVGYQCGTRSIRTINKWFDGAYSSLQDPALHPELVVAIQEAVSFFYCHPDHGPGSMQRKVYLLPARDPNGDIVTGKNGEFVAVIPNQAEAKGRSTMYVPGTARHTYNMEYRVCSDTKHGFVLADAPSVLVDTLNTIARILQYKIIRSPEIESYLNFNKALQLESVI